MIKGFICAPCAPEVGKVKSRHGKFMWISCLYYVVFQINLKYVKRVLTFVIPLAGHGQARHVKMTLNYFEELTGDQISKERIVKNEDRSKFVPVTMFGMKCELAFFAAFDRALTEDIERDDLRVLEAEFTARFQGDVPRDNLVAIKAAYGAQVIKYTGFLSEVSSDDHVVIML